jgi:hypothetical protein
MKTFIRFASQVALSAPLVWAWSSTAHAYCPSYTPAGTANSYKCAINPAPGINPTVAQMNALFLKAAQGKAGWGVGGPDIGTINQGCNKPKPPVPVAARFPCVLIKAMMMRESAWQQFCKPDAPASQVGNASRTIVSFDCGYGIGQVTSGMHVGENPGFDRAKVASDPLYNLATGMTILRSKWVATACVGDNNPDIVEDWYTAVWAYNGLAYSNNPNNPNLKAGRGVYNPATGGAYAYQELIFGWMEHPPSAAHWPRLEAAYPNRGEVGNTGRPGNLKEPSCASPTDCTKTRITHSGSCIPAPPVSDAGVDSGGDAEPIDPPLPDAGGAGPKPPEEGPNKLADDPLPAPDSGCCAAAPNGHSPADSAILIAVAACAAAFASCEARSA